MAETLYEMTQATQALFEMLMNDEIDEQTFNDTVEGMGVIEKIVGYCQMTYALKADIEMFKNEIDRLEKKKKSCENKMKWLKNQLLCFYNANGRKKINAGTFTVTVRRSEAVDISDLSKIPQEYMKVKTEPDKTAIKNAIKQGVEIDGAIIQEKESVQIK